MSERFAWSIKRGRIPTAAAIIVASFALALVLASLFPAFFQSWNDRIVDRFFILRYHLVGQSETFPYLVHAVVDDSTYGALGVPGWGREPFGLALALLQQAGVRLIACDVLFKDPGFPSTDRLLLAAAGMARTIVWPLLLYPETPGPDRDPPSGQYRLYPGIRKPGHPPAGGHAVAPFAELRATARGFGHINASPDRDGRIRRIPLLYRLGDGYVPALSLKAVLEYCDLGQQDLEVIFGKHLILRGARLREGMRKNLLVPIDGQGRIIINFAGPEGLSFQSFPVQKLLKAGQENEARLQLYDLLEGALVLLSDASTANKDYGPGLFAEVYRFSGLHLNVINSILTQNLLADQARPGAILSALLFATLLCLPAARFKAPGFSLSCILLYVLFLLFSLCLFIFRHVVPAVAAPTLGFAFALLSIGAYGLLRSECERAILQQRIQAANRELSAKRRELDLANERLLRIAQLEQGQRPEEGRGAEEYEQVEASSRPILQEAFGELVTRNQQMLAKFQYIETIAGNDNPVLITGESGVGKELVAKAIHKLSGRRGKFVSENIAGLDDTLLTDTLFGHARGAFTDAGLVRKGLVEEARSGTLFLDEIGDLSVSSQVKLLRLIEEREYRSLGMDEVKIADARIIIATNVDLQKRLEEGKFREDLFFRLTHRIDIPPLRERLDDLPLLLEHFAGISAKTLGTRKPVVPAQLTALLQSYGFPGNIRELKNLVEDAVRRNKARTLSLAYFREYLRDNSNQNGNRGVQLSFADRFPTLREVEQFLVAEALRRTRGNQNGAARLLGLSASALSRRLSRQHDGEER